MSQNPVDYDVAIGRLLEAWQSAAASIVDSLEKLYAVIDVWYGNLPEPVKVLMASGVYSLDNLPNDLESSITNDCEHKEKKMAQDNEIHVGFFCEVCEDFFDETEVDQDNALYECSSCGEVFTRANSYSDNHQCPICMKFASKLANYACPNCDGELEEGVEFVEGEDGTKSRLKD